MKNAHIAFVSVPIASHLNPTLPIVSALLRRGHRVSYVVSPPFVSRVETLGAEIVEYAFGALTAKTVDEDSFCRLATSTLTRITAFYERNRPDLLIYDLTAFAGRILGSRLRIPMARTSPHFAFARSVLDRQIPDSMYRESVLANIRRARPFLERHRVDGDDFIFHKEALNIQLFPRDFEPCNDAIDESYLHAGRCAGEQSGFGNWHRGHDDRPVVLVAPSRSYMQGAQYVKTCVQALADLPWRVVLSVDDDAEVAAIGSLASNFEIIQRTSHTRILPYASLVIGMGGTATGSEAAYHGVPLVMTSLGFKELEWLSENLARVGLGTHLIGPQLDPQTLRGAALEVLRSTIVQGKVALLQRRIRHEAGAEETANRIEDYLDSRSTAR